MKHQLKDLSITRVALVPAGSNPKADIVLFKSKPVEPPTQPKESGFMKKNIDKSKLNATELSQLEALLAKSATDITDTVTGQPANAEEDIIKALPPEAQALIKKAQDTAAAAQAEAERASATALFEKAQRETNEFINTHTDVVKAYPGKAADHASLLYRVKKAVSAEDYTALETLIKAGASALSQLMTTDGNDTVASVNAASDQLVSIAKEKMKTNAKLSFSQAYEETLTERPDLVREARSK